MEFLREGEVICDAPAKYKASVWKHFGFLGNDVNGVINEDRTKCICCICKGKLKYSGNTTNLTTHLSRKHKMLSPEASKQEHVMMKTVQQPKLASFVKKSAKKNLDVKEKNVITNAITESIVKDMRPFSVVENSGFGNLINILEPR